MGEVESLDSNTDCELIYDSCALQIVRLAFNETDFFPVGYLCELINEQIGETDKHQHW